MLFIRTKDKYPLSFSFLSLWFLVWFRRIAEAPAPLSGSLHNAHHLMPNTWRLVQSQNEIPKETPQLKPFILFFFLTFPTLQKLSSFPSCVCSDVICGILVLVPLWLASLLVTKQASAFMLAGISHFTAGAPLVNSPPQRRNNLGAELTELFPIKFQKCPTRPLSPLWQHQD